MNATKYGWRPGDDEALDERRAVARKTRSFNRTSLIPPENKRRREASSHTNARGLPKTTFLSVDAAQQRADALFGTDRRMRDVHVYKCHTCFGYHIGRSSI